MQATEERAESRTAVEGPAWKALESHYKKVRKLHLRKLFADDPTRGERLTASAVGIELDYSKNRITDQTLELLFRLAKDAGLRERIDAMFPATRSTSPRTVRSFTPRCALPLAHPSSSTAQNVVPQVQDVLAGWPISPTQVRSGAWKGHTGKRMRNVVNIGIGGSDLGPVMAYEALRHYSAARHDFPLRLQRRRHRLRRGRSRSGPRGDAIHCLLQDFHHARNNDQRPIRPRLVAGWIGWR